MWKIAQDRRENLVFFFGYKFKVENNLLYFKKLVRNIKVLALVLALYIMKVICIIQSYASCFKKNVFNMNQ